MRDRLPRKRRCEPIDDYGRALGAERCINDQEPIFLFDNEKIVQGPLDQEQASGEFGGSDLSLDAVAREVRLTRRPG